MMRKFQTIALALFILASTCTLFAAAETKAPAPPKVSTPAVFTSVAPATKIKPPALTVYNHKGTIFPLMVPALLAIILVLLLYIRQLQKELSQTQDKNSPPPAAKSAVRSRSVAPLVILQVSSKRNVRIQLAQ